MIFFYYIDLIEAVDGFMWNLFVLVFWFTLLDIILT